MFRIRIALLFSLILLAACTQQETKPQGIHLEKISNPIPSDSNGDQVSENATPADEQTVFPLFINDFQARWNAISEEQTGDVYIHKLDRNEESGHYVASLTDRLHMEIQTSEDQRINKLTIHQTGSTNSDFIKMLTSWWQALIITNPQTELHEIDAIFAEIGIGPNTNFDELKETTFTFGGITYKVRPINGYMAFEVNYPESNSIQGGR
jgi:hypothetical protein